MRPIGQAAIGLQTLDAGFEHPQKFSSGAIEREDFLRWSDTENHAVNNQGAGLQATGFPGVEGPCDFELLDVFAIDLRERRVVVVSGAPPYTDQSVFDSAALAR